MKTDRELDITEFMKTSYRLAKGIEAARHLKANGYRQDLCHYCKGEGFRQHSGIVGLLECAQCHGKGFNWKAPVKIHVMREELPKQDEPKTIFCKECAGLGWRAIGGDPYDCPTCIGTGILQKTQPETATLESEGYCG